MQQLKGGHTDCQVFAYSEPGQMATKQGHNQDFFFLSRNSFNECLPGTNMESFRLQAKTVLFTQVFLTSFLEVLLLLFSAAGTVINMVFYSYILLLLFMNCKWSHVALLTKK